MKKDHLLYVNHILEAISAIELFMSSTSKDSFYNDKMCYSAVLYNLQIMAESTKRIPEKIKQKHPTIPWKDIVGFRNILVHEYLEGLDNNIIWHIISSELPLLKSAMLQEK